MICSSRETVTRLLAMLGRQQIVQITADSIVIQDRPALEDLALAELTAFRDGVTMLLQRDRQFEHRWNGVIVYNSSSS